MRYLITLLLLLVFIFTFVVGQISTLAESYKISPEVMEAVQKQIDKEKIFGYDGFSLVYVVEGDSNISLVYTVTNSTLDPESKYLSGYTVSKISSGEWVYVGSKTISYSNETDLEKMKSWADQNVN